MNGIQFFKTFSESRNVIVHIRCKRGTGFNVKVMNLVTGAFTVEFAVSRDRYM